MIPYGKQLIDGRDLEAVTTALQADFITTGPKVGEFEAALATFARAKQAVAIANGTAALHAAMFAAGVGPGDEVIVPTMTFAASANCVVYQGGTPVFADVLPDSLLIDPADVEKKISARTKAVIAVDYAGQPCDYARLRALTEAHKLVLVADAAHSLGAEDGGRMVGTLADLTTLSFHPVKHITTGEGGMVLTERDDYAARMRVFRNHGITTDARQRAEQGSWFYRMESLGYNYRITDFQCALGLSQLKKLPKWLERRRALAGQYDQAFAETAFVTPLKNRAGTRNAYHLYVIKLTGLDRNRAFTTLRAGGVGVNVHYIPVHLHPYYRDRFHTAEGLCPVAEAAFQNLLSLPMYPGLSDREAAKVIKAVKALEQL